MRVRTWPVMGLGLAALWVFVRGVEPALDAVVGQLLLGLVVGLPIAFVFRRLYPERIDVARGARGVPYAVLYVVVFLKEIMVANLDVAYRVLAPGQTIEPEVILIPLRVQTDLGVTTIANSITVTPGTITLDHVPESNALYVHVIDERDIDEVIQPIRRWERYALVVFDEELDPDDPAPPITITGGDDDGG